MTVAPADTGRYLVARGRGNDLSRLARQQAWWQAWTAQLPRAPVAAGPAADPGLASLFAALGTGEVSVEVVVLDALDGRGGAGEVYRARPDDLAALVHDALPDAAALGADGKVRVELLNGSGGPAPVGPAALRLLGAGARVVLTAAAPSPADGHTTIFYRNGTDRAAALRLQKALGGGRVTRTRDVLDGADVRVLLGLPAGG